MVKYGFLVFKIVIDERLVDFCGLGNLIDTGGIISFFLKKVGRSLQDTFPGLILFFMFHIVDPLTNRLVNSL